jgi:hypothetical protein
MTRRPGHRGPPVGEAVRALPAAPGHRGPPVGEAVRALPAAPGNALHCS